MSAAAANASSSVSRPSAVACSSSSHVTSEPSVLPEPYLSSSDDALRSCLLTLQQLLRPGKGTLASALPALCRLANALAYALMVDAEQHAGQVALRAPAGRSFGELVRVQRQFAAAVDPSEFVLPVSLGRTWYRSYVELRPHSSAAAAPLDDSALTSVVAVVEYILGEIIIGAANQNYSRRSDVISSADVLASIVQYPALQNVCEWIGAPFAPSRVPEVSTKGLSAAYALHPSAMPLMWLEEHFAGNAPAMQQISARCWFNDPAKVAQYAQQYARGDLLAGDALLYRQDGVRLLRFYGRTASLLSVPNASGCMLSFELLDSPDRWHPYILEFRRGRPNLCTVLDGHNAAPVWIHRFLPDRCLEHDDSIQPKEIAWTLQFAKRVALSRTWATGHQNSVLLDAPVSAASAIGNRPAAGPSAFASSSNVRNLMSNIAWLSRLDAVECARLDSLCRQICDAVDSRKWTPQLFAAHHPLRVRAHFTAALLDAASQSVGLPVLPMDLLQLIGEYEPATLPVIEAEEAQLSTAARKDRISYAASVDWETPPMVLRADREPVTLVDFQLEADESSDDDDQEEDEVDDDEEDSESKTSDEN